jgi:Lon protease-like protein
MRHKPNAFTLPFPELPERLPLFPLPGVAVMPGTQVPLNVFEPRYLRLVLDVLGTHRMLGLVQPESRPPRGGEPALYRTGTAGRITSFSEAARGERLMIVLTGVCRFRILEELLTDAPYRSARVDWGAFADDYAEQAGGIPDREALFRSLRAYCDLKEVQITWEDAQSLEDQALVDLLTVHLPLEVAEKQALIECVGCAERAQLLQGLLDMTLARGGAARGVHH